jgi:GNAT superfamily N-acetyltransferase
VLIEKFDAAADQASVQALYEAYAAGAPVDEPGGPVMSARVWCGLAARGWCDEPRENWLARAVLAGTGLAGTGLAGTGPTGTGPASGSILGGYSLELPDRENLDRAGLTLLVAPDRRRAGVGSGLLRHALARAAELGRTTVTSLVLEGTAGDGFARTVGAVAELTEVRRTDRLSEAKGLRRYSVAAADTATGELAALTQLSIEEADPVWGHQELTAVVRAHRGHRLGLLTKVDMLELLNDREPQIRFVQTWNGETNAHMVAINQALGFGHPHRVTCWRLPTGALPETGPLATGSMAPTYRR